MNIALIATDRIPFFSFCSYILIQSRQAGDGEVRRRYIIDICSFSLSSFLFSFFRNIRSLRIFIIFLIYISSFRGGAQQGSQGVDKFYTDESSGIQM